MCGIVGYIGNKKAKSILIDGLTNLEYRGYDSAGVTIMEKENFKTLKTKGRVKELSALIQQETLEGGIGIAHTRWATHGKPSATNSHPHNDNTNTFSVVHNGIIENHAELKTFLKEKNYEFLSQTDTEVIPNLIHYYFSQEKNDTKPFFLKAVQKTCQQLKGSYAIGVLCTDFPDCMIVVRKDSPLVIGKGEGENFISSDIPAYLGLTRNFYLLKDNEFAILTKNEVEFFDEQLNPIHKDITRIDWNATSAEKNGYEDFMLKEIYEQPKVIYDTVQCYIKDDYMNQMAFLDEFDAIDIVGCGSAYHAGLVGASLLKKYGDIPVQVAVASEYRYTKQFYQKNHLLIVISQSGETADTLAVLRNAKEQGIHTLTIVNVVGSSIAREADQVFYIKAGVEVAVATTKAYTCQLALLSLFACYLGIKRGILKEDVLSLYDDLGSQIETILKEDALIKDVAQFIQNKNDIFYLGRQVDYALCMEASLKLKEVSYLHSEAYAAGELKHGTISLIEEGTPVISLLTDEELFLKTLSNVKEVVSRGAFSVIITNQEIMDKTLYQKMIQLPKTLDLTGGILVMVVCQLLAYYVALYKECDIDKPRNLAKSVTVE